MASKGKKNLLLNWRLKLVVQQKAEKYFSSLLGYPSSLEEERNDRKKFKHSRKVGINPKSSSKSL